jgi:hypothetical protein
MLQRAYRPEARVRRIMRSTARISRSRCGVRGASGSIRLRQSAAYAPRQPEIPNIPRDSDMARRHRTSFAPLSHLSTALSE